MYVCFEILGMLIHQMRAESFTFKAVTFYLNTTWMLLKHPLLMTLSILCSVEVFVMPAQPCSMLFVLWSSNVFCKHICFIICLRYPLGFYDTCLFKFSQKIPFYFHMTCSPTNIPNVAVILCPTSINSCWHR